MGLFHSGLAHGCHVEVQIVMVEFLIFQEKPLCEFLFVFYLHTPNF